MVTVAKRRAIDQYRAQVRRRRRDARLVGHTVLTVPDVADSIAARAEARWVDEQARILLRPQVYRLIRLLADGVPLDEAANALGMTARSAESHLFRARRQVRSALAKTLALLGGVLACGRRVTVPAVTVTATAATAFLFVTPWVANEPDLQLLPETTRDVALGYAANKQSSAGGAHEPARIRRSVLSLRRDVRGATAPTSVHSGTTVSTPVAGIRTYDSEDGQHSATPVEQVQHCLENLQVTISYVGCEKKP